VLAVRAQPGASANAIRGDFRGALKVAVTQVAEKGKANKVLIAFLAKSLGLRRSQLSLLSGVTTTDKQVLIREVRREDLRRRLEQLLQSSQDCSTQDRSTQDRSTQDRSTQDRSTR
jgi:uncharacterized protein YggU (UPF0235/DUF167 family)